MSWYLFEYIWNSSIYRFLFIAQFLLLVINTNKVLQNNLQLYFEYGYTAIRSLFVYAILGILVYIYLNTLLILLFIFFLLKMKKILFRVFLFWLFHYGNI